MFYSYNVAEGLSAIWQLSAAHGVQRDDRSGGHGDAVAIGRLRSAHEPHPVEDQPQVRPVRGPVRVSVRSHAFQRVAV